MNGQRLGGRVRRLRQQHRLTQAQMADQLGISASYLNLIEHNQRNLSVPVLLKLAQRFGADLQSLAAEDDRSLVSDLMEVFADPLFDGHELRPSDLDDLAANTPHLGRAMLSLYHAYRGGRPPAGGIEPAEAPGGMPSEEVADFIQSKDTHFAKLETAADGLWREARLHAGDLPNGLVAYLNGACGVTVEVLPAERMHGRLRSYDPTTMRLSLSEMLPLSGRTFQLAHQVGVLTQRPLIEATVSGGKFLSAEAEALARFALANYFAGVVLMPYERFLEAARTTRYDIEVLERRFDASFEQVAHRLTELRRPGTAGIPFHFVRVDVAGNISKRFSGSGIAIPRFGGACPRWNVYDAFATPGLIRTQVSRMPNGETYFCIARTVAAIGRTAARRRSGRNLGRLAISLGCPVAYARDMIYADGLDLEDEASITPIGVSCRVCERVSCEDRAFPSIHHGLAFDANVRGSTPFGFRAGGTSAG